MSDFVRPNIREISGGKAELADLLSRVESHLRAGNDGNGGGMEVRVAKLESDVEHMKRDVGELRTDMRDVRDRLTRIETRVDHLPSKGFVVSVVMLGFALVAGVVAFQSQIQQFVAASSTPLKP